VFCQGDRQGGEQQQVARHVALEQQLAYCSHISQVAVDLELHSEMSKSGVDEQY
jgi:hypothetical protein